MRPIVAIAGAAVLAGCAQLAAPPQVPAALAPPAGQTETLTLSARGVQLYECRGDTWAFVAPEAELFDAGGRRVGRHGAGPTWQADDGSRVTGRVRARADAPRPDAIPWLLLATTSDGAPGTFGRVASVQRIRTEGGLAPAVPCTPGQAGAVARVPYAADYRFFATP